MVSERRSLTQLQNYLPLNIFDVASFKISLCRVICMITFKINIDLQVWHFHINFAPITTIPIFIEEFFEAQARIKSDQKSVI